jgi:hypothetical protein
VTTPQHPGPGSRGDTGGADDAGDRPALVVIRGDASPEEVAALVVVLQAATAASPAPVGSSRRQPPQWSAHRRRVRGAASVPPAGPGGWRASALPR